MRIALIGSGGMLGVALTKVFSAKHTVIPWDKPRVDLTNLATLEAAFFAATPDVVINAAAYNAVDLIETDAVAHATAERINGTAVGELAALAAARNIPLVHFSTDYIFAGDDQTGYPESAAPAPQSRYAHTKALGEQALQKNTDLFYLVRLSRLFGPPGTTASSKKSFVDLMIDLVEKHGKTELKLVHEEVASPTYSLDLAHLVEYLLAKKLPYGIYHGASAGACTWYEFAQEVFQRRGLSVKTFPVLAAEFPRPAKRPAFSQLLCTKLPPARPWQDALAEYLGLDTKS